MRAEDRAVDDLVGGYNDKDRSMIDTISKARDHVAAWIGSDRAPRSWRDLADGHRSIARWCQDDGCPADAEVHREIADLFDAVGDEVERAHAAADATAATREKGYYRRGHTMETTTRYAITHVSMPQGKPLFRRLTLSMKASATYATRGEAEAALVLMAGHNDALTSLTADERSTVRVDPVECYLHGDPVRFIIPEV